MARLSVSVANCTFTAGLNPPLAIFITRASGSVVLTRSSLFRILSPHLPFPALFAAFSCFSFSSGNCSSARFTRFCFSSARRFSAFTFLAFSAASFSGASSCRRNSSTCCLVSSSSLCKRSSRRKLAAPAPTRTRTPSWLMRLTFTNPCSTNDAITGVNKSSKASP